MCPQGHSGCSMGPARRSLATGLLAGTAWPRRKLPDRCALRWAWPPAFCPAAGPGTLSATPPRPAAPLERPGGPVSPFPRSNRMGCGPGRRWKAPLGPGPEEEAAGGAGTLPGAPAAGKGPRWAGPHAPRRERRSRSSDADAPLLRLGKPRGTMPGQPRGLSQDSPLRSKLPETGSVWPQLREGQRRARHTASRARVHRWPCAGSAHGASAERPTAGAHGRCVGRAWARACPRALAWAQCGRVTPARAQREPGTCHSGLSAVVSGQGLSGGEAILDGTTLQTLQGSRWV